MRISRLYVEQALRVGETVRLDEECAHYVRTVLRLKRGFNLTLFNGDGQEYVARLAETSREAVRAEIVSASARDAESPLSIHLGLGIARGERMDWALQKAVELGAGRITPLFTEHCVVRLDETRKDHRLVHWRKIVRGACEQCGRNRLPALDEPLELSEWIVRAEGTKLFLDPEGVAGLCDLPPPTAGVSLLSGPEGGFAERERMEARADGFVPVRLGPRILRAETAVLTALAAVQVMWGDGGRGV